MADSLRVQVPNAPPPTPMQPRGFLGKTYDYWFDQPRYQAGSIPIPGEGGSPRVSVSDPSDPGAAIRELRQKIAEEVAAPTPRANPVTDPQFRWLTSTSKTPDSLLASSRQDAFYQNLARLYPPMEGGDNPEWHKIPAEDRDTLRAYAYNTDGMRDRIRSGYRPTGVLGTGSGLGAAATWAQSLMGMGYGAGQQLANERFKSRDSRVHDDGPYPEAERESGRALATFLAPLSPLTGEAYHGSFSDRRDAAARADEIIDKLPWDHPAHLYSGGSKLPTPAMQFRHDELLQEVAAGAGKDGQTYLEEAGYPSWFSIPAGELTDAVLNPIGSFGGLGPAVKLANAGKYGKLAGVIGSELLPGLGLRATAAMNALDGGSQARSEILSDPIMGLPRAPSMKDVVPDSEWAELEEMDRQYMQRQRMAEFKRMVMEDANQPQR